MYLHLLILLSLLPVTFSLSPPYDPDLLQQFKNSPIDVYDLPSIGHHELDRQITTNDPKNICCTTNYSAVWDDDDELIVFVADNFFCPKVLKKMKEEDALHPDRLWETLMQSLNRAYRHGAGAGKEYYVGNYPGVTAMPIQYESLMAMRRCLAPFVKILLDGESYFIARQTQEKKFTENATYSPDLEPNSLPTYSYKNSEEERELSYYDDEEVDQPIHGIPIIPLLAISFWASAAFPAQNLSQGHSQAHTDGQHTGLASVFTLTDDPKYEACGTTFNKLPNGISIIHNKNILRTTSIQSSINQEEALDRGESSDSGWLNTSSNRFSDIIVLARNKYNRFIMYPSMRLHTAYIPSEEYINADPAQGRLTMNTFWGVYENKHALCSSVIQTYLFQNHVGRLTDWPETKNEYLNACHVCKSWQNFCQWCPYRQLCFGDSTDTGVAEPCKDVPMNGTSNGMLGTETTCEESAALMETCIIHDSCNTCTNATGCGWCLNSGLCKLEVAGICSNKLSHVGKLGEGKCPTIPTNPTFGKYPARTCNTYSVCHKCRDAGCSWCNNGLLDPTNKRKSKLRACVADLEFMCLTNDESQIVGTYGTDVCDKELSKTVANREMRNQFIQKRVPLIGITKKKERIGDENGEDDENKDKNTGWGIERVWGIDESDEIGNVDGVGDEARKKESLERKGIKDIFFVVDNENL